MDINIKQSKFTSHLEIRKKYKEKAEVRKKKTKT